MISISGEVNFSPKTGKRYLVKMFWKGNLSVTEKRKTNGRGRKRHKGLHLKIFKFVIVFNMMKLMVILFIVKLIAQFNIFK